MSNRNFDQTLAYVNMNPLNIRFDKKTNWFGSRLKDRKGFVQFAAFSYGYRAAVMILRSYAKRNVRTIGEIIERWAPRSELRACSPEHQLERKNDTEAYINSVLSFMSPRQSEPFTVDRETMIDLKNRDLVVQLLLAMTRVEMGANHAQVAKMRPYAELGYDLAVTTKNFFA